MKARICDRCNTAYGERSGQGKTLSGSVLKLVMIQVRHLWAGNMPDALDLCGECSEECANILAAFLHSLLTVEIRDADDSP